MNVLSGWASDHGPTWVMSFRDLDEQLRFLRRQVETYRSHPQIRDLALQIIKDAGVQARDKKSQALAIGQWVQDNIYYVHELPERFQTPIETLREKAGDCDDGVQLICSLLECIGILSKMVAMKFCDGLMCDWKHIFPVAIIESTGNFLPLDWTMKNYRVIDVMNPVAYAQSQGKSVSLKIA